MLKNTFKYVCTDNYVYFLDYSSSNNNASQDTDLRNKIKQLLLPVPKS